MNKTEVIKLIGKEKWNKFQKFMFGQTVKLNKDNSIDYYDCDVKLFMEIEKIVAIGD